MENVKIIFNNGTELDAVLNGGILITETEPVLPVNLRNIKVVGDNYNQVYDHGRITPCHSLDDRYWFILDEISSFELAMMKSQADIEFIAMEAGIDLD